MNGGSASVKPDRNTASRDALDSAVVEACEDVTGQTRFPEEAESPADSSCTPK